MSRSSLSHQRGGTWRSASLILLVTLLAACGSSSASTGGNTASNPSPTPTQMPMPSTTPTPSPTPTPPTRTVFLIVMENHNWSAIFNNPSAPYINKTLLPMSSYAQQYYNPPGN